MTQIIGSITSRSKRQTRDRISNLPPEIQDQILSLLSPAEAIRSRMLSTQWRKVVASRYEFSELVRKHYEFYTRYNFNGAISRCSVSRSRATPKRNDVFWDHVTKTLANHGDADIQNLRIHVMHSHPELASRIDEWVSLAVTHNVCELQLSVHLSSLERLPSCHFTCRTLTKLALRFIILAKLPTIVEFPNLKTLALEIVEFRDISINFQFPNLKTLTPESVEFFHRTLTRQFFSSFPVLEHLNMRHCIIPVNDNNVFTVSPASLKTLDVNSCRIEGDIIISSTTLSKINYRGDLAHAGDFDQELKDFINNGFRCISPLSCVPHASFTFVRPPSPKYDSLAKIVSDAALQILDVLQNVVRLSLLGYIVQALTRESKIYERLPAPCCTLRHLQLDMFPTRNQVQIIAALLPIYPNLQTLRVNVKIGQFSNELVKKVEYQRPDNRSENSILEKLSKVEIQNFEGTEYEVELVRYILGNASTMQTVNIVLSKDVRPDKVSPIQEKFQTFRKASQNVAVSLS